ncbi:hypothetical protein ANTPLA_LOCUS10623 [Anthophora plagiata]
MFSPFQRAVHTASGPLSTRHRNGPKVSACKYPLENGTSSLGNGWRVGWEPSGVREEEARRPGPRAKEGSRVNFLSVNERGWTSTMNVDRVQENDRIRGWWCRIS